MTNIVPLRRAAVDDGSPPDDFLVKQLEMLLEAAKSKTIVAFAWASMQSDGNPNNGWSVADDGHGLNLLASIDLMHSQYRANMELDDDGQGNR